MIGLVFATMVRHLRVVPAPDDDAAGVDAELVQRCLSGERPAFDTLYLRHAATVHGRIVRLIGRVPDVDDLTQEVFLQAFRSLPRFRGDAAFGTWLFRIVTNVCLAEMRRQRRRPSVPLAPDDLQRAAGSDHGDSLEVRAQNWEQCRRALLHLQKLKPKYRIAFVLRHVEQLTLEEIGIIVGANAPAVGQRVRKAERELAARIDREERGAARRRGETHVAS